MAKCYASKVVKQAQSLIGRKESNGTHKLIIDTYNSHKPLARGYKVKYTDEWCATFVSAVAIEVGYTDIIPTECGCGQMIALFKELGCWIENDAYVPDPGDVIFYDWEDDGKGDNTGWPNHVGIVEKVSDGVITVIEGNYNCEVKRRTIKVNGKYIRGYGVPEYDTEAVTATPSKSVDAVAKDVIAGKYGNGDARKAKIEAEGYNYAEVQARVNEILKEQAKATSIYYSKYTGSSYGINTVFKAIGVPDKFVGSWKDRKPVAVKNGISNYTGSAAQNTNLIKLAKKGKLKKA